MSVFFERMWAVRKILKSKTLSWVTVSLNNFSAVSSGDRSPAVLGFAQPAEWANHAATWSVWPRDDDYWGGCLGMAQRDLALFLNTLAEFEPVRLLVHDEASAQDARSHLSAKIQLHIVPNRDIWLRDSGPIFVTHPQGKVAGVNWQFNGWGDRFPSDLDNQIPLHFADILALKLFDPGIVLEGGSIETNGNGLCLTTQQCLLAPTRNPRLSASEIEQYLNQYLGQQEVLWLDQGLEGDHTDGHIDTITRFVDEQTVVTSICEDPNDANFEPMQANLSVLKDFRDRQGHPLTVIPLPLPQTRIDFDGERLPLTYANFYIANGAVLVPVYDDPNDERALEILRGCFGDREVIGLNARGLIHGGGAFHCATQQQPRGEI